MIAIPLPGKKAAIKVHAEIKWFTNPIRMKSAFSIQIVVGVSRCENNHRFVDNELDGTGKGR